MSLQNGSVARIWFGTIPYAGNHDISGGLDAVKFAKGQREIGAGGYEHWQLVVWLGKPGRLSALKKIFGKESHWEPCKSVAAEEYVWKDDTAVPDTRFEVGAKPMQRSSDKDWGSIRDNARCGKLEDIPADIYVRCYQSLRRIESDHLVPVGIEREVFVFWGKSGTGKSKLAWSEAGLEAYPKDPRSKFWDGYRGHKHVVLDEFRGGIDISHILRWLDRYPVIVEIKGSSTVLRAEKIWITSNLDPRLWYPDLDVDTLEALLRRMKIKQFILYVYLLGRVRVSAALGLG